MKKVEKVEKLTTEQGYYVTERNPTVVPERWTLARSEQRAVCMLQQRTGAQSAVAAKDRARTLLRRRRAGRERALQPNGKGK